MAGMNNCRAVVEQKGHTTDVGKCHEKVDTRGQFVDDSGIVTVDQDYSSTSDHRQLLNALQNPCHDRRLEGSRGDLDQGEYEVLHQLQQGCELDRLLTECYDGGGDDEFDRLLSCNREAGARVSGISICGGVVGGEIDQTGVRMSGISLDCAGSMESIHHFTDEGGGEDNGLEGIDEYLQRSSSIYGNNRLSLVGDGGGTGAGEGYARDSVDWEQLLKWRPAYLPDVFAEFGALKDDNKKYSIYLIVFLVFFYILKNNLILIFFI